MSEDDIHQFLKIWFSKDHSQGGASNVAENVKEKWKKEGKTDAQQDPK